MIDLFTVKLNNKYDFVQAELPTSNGTWLCSETSENYTKGYSYEVKNNVATRIETATDEKILSAIEPTLKAVKIYLGYDIKDCHNELDLCDTDCCCKPQHCKPKFPEEVYFYISKMISYDVYQRTSMGGLKSESIGNYSYTADDYKIGSLYYPPEILSGLDVFKRVRFL